MCRRTTSILASFRSAIVPLLCESLALSQQLIRLDYSTQPRFETAIAAIAVRSEEHTSELQSLMRISYAVFCLKKKKNKNQNTPKHHSRKKQMTNNTATKQ